jgi:uncharacterized membrane protein YdfJ with MMPL/SSD domain
MSSSANAEFWEKLSGSIDIGYDGYTLGLSKDDADKADTSAAPITVPASTSSTSSTGAGVGAWIQKNPLAVGVGVVAVLALAALSMGKK